MMDDAQTCVKIGKIRAALMIDFRRTYNERWLIERQGHRSPAQFRRDQMDTLPLAPIDANRTSGVS
jgi:hypothetical protein